MAMALITALLALPLGLLVAWCLIAMVNVKAFGWRLPFEIFPAHLALLGDRDAGLASGGAVADHQADADAAGATGEGVCR